MELSWDELELSRHENGRAMFRSVLRRRKDDGSVEEIPIFVCVPNPADQVQARVTARVWFSQQKHLDPDRDYDLFQEMEQTCLLARAIRDEKTHGQLMDHEELAEWDEGCLKDIQERINVVKDMLDPRESGIDEDKFWHVVLRVAKRGDLGPLVDIVGHEQMRCVVRMAREACNSPTAPSSVQSYAILMQGRSPSASSNKS